jgi:hypothetical protein
MNHESPFWVHADDVQPDDVLAQIRVYVNHMTRENQAKYDGAWGFLCLETVVEAGHAYSIVKVTEPRGSEALFRITCTPESDWETD